MLYPSDLEIQASDWSFAHKAIAPSIQQKHFPSQADLAHSLPSHNSNFKLSEPISADLSVNNLSANKRAIISCLLDRQSSSNSF
jgi:hypothetical protein